MEDDIYLLRELIQAAKGFGGTDVESHLDAAENIVDRMESLTTELADALEGVLRIVSAYSLSQGLGKNQAERVEKAKAALAKMGR